MTDWQEELVCFIKDILCADIGLNLKQVVQLTEIGYNKTFLDRRDLYYDITNKSEGGGKG